MKNLYGKPGIIGLIAVIVGFLLKSIYRPYAYQNEWNDFGLANSGPSFLYVIGFSQLLLVKKHSYPWLVIASVTIGSVLYEIIQSRYGSVDDSDILASVLGGITSLLLLKTGKSSKE